MPGREHLGHPRDPVAELRVRGRVVRDLRPGLAHQRDLRVGEPHAVRRDAAVEQDPAVVRDLRRPPAEPLLRVLDLGERLVQVDVDPGVEVVGERAGVRQQGPRRRAGATRSRCRPRSGRSRRRSTARRRSGCPPACRGRARRRRCRWTARRGSRSPRRPSPRPSELAVHVVDGGDAALDRLAVARERGPVRLLRVQRADDRIPAGLEVLPQRQVVAPALAERPCGSAGRRGRASPPCPSRRSRVAPSRRRPRRPRSRPR